MKVNRFICRDWSHYQTRQNADALRRYIVNEVKSRPAFGINVAEPQRTQTISTNRLPSVVMNAQERISLEQTQSIKKDLID